MMQILVFVILLAVTYTTGTLLDYITPAQALTSFLFVTTAYVILHILFEVIF